jgi:adenosylmethionine-8-amino-7-oxononanoate aminotransferase
LVCARARPARARVGRRRDAARQRGREFIDGNSSIWTNLHGHRHPRIDAAIRRQLEQVAHTSFLGFTNPPAAQLAQELVQLWPAGTLTRVFFSDNGSTAIEVALKMAAQYWQLTGAPERREFAAFSGAYHGDTMGASSLGGISAFHGRFASWQFPAVHVQSLTELHQLDSGKLAAVVIEPLIQGAAGMRLWPRGMLAELRRWCDARGVFLITDEVMTGFGRTGTMFACEQEQVVPDFVALAKGLTGGYMPLAATLTTDRVFRSISRRTGADALLWPQLHRQSARLRRRAGESGDLPRGGGALRIAGEDRADEQPARTPGGERLCA